MSHVTGRKGTVIVSGILFWYPLAGVTYQFLHYLIGLRRLGYDVYYIEDSARWVYDPVANEMSPDARSNVERIAPILEEHGFAGHWAFRGRYQEGQVYGLPESRILQLYREADALLNVTGAQELLDDYAGRMRLVYIESDPFAFQVKLATGDAGALSAASAHHSLFTFGENLGADDCTVPVGSFNWMPTRQPVALELWANRAPDGERYRTITTWSNKDSDLVFEGETYYWTKDREFRKFLDLPGRTSVDWELAAGADDEVKQLLARHGWNHVDSAGISANPDCYRTYIEQSRAEFTVARDQYVRPNTGWFSDRSACYLAAGRPVITQETGFSKRLPIGKGLFAFKTRDDILSAVETIESDYRASCRAAVEVASEFFAAEKVLGSLMDRAGLS
jgi:hypothetical protein